jgi:hypothetical protein
MEAQSSELLVVTAGNNSQAVPWEQQLQGARLVKRRVRFGFGPSDSQAKTEQIILAK